MLGYIENKTKVTFAKTQQEDLIHVTLIKQWYSPDTGEALPLEESTIHLEPLMRRRKVLQSELADIDAFLTDVDKIPEKAGILTKADEIT